LGKKPAAFGILAFRLVLLSLAMMTVLRNAVWSDPIVLYQESVNLAPGHYRPRLLLGEALLDLNRRDEAMNEFWTATRLRPENPTGYIKLARCYADVGKFSQARILFLKARELDPGDRSIPRMLEALVRMEARLKPSPQ
jgi:Flp pilus assembly protein TadD